MRELALAILDIAKNGVRAGAEKIKIDVTAETKQNRLSITISDDGKGMSGEMMRRVTDPFTTTRTTRKVGMGLPLFKMDAVLSDGTFTLSSKEGAGTSVAATYRLDHVDRPPMGDLADTMTVLIGGNPDIRWIFSYRIDHTGFTFDSREIAQVMDGVPIGEPEVLKAIGDMLSADIIESNGGIII